MFQFDLQGVGAAASLILTLLIVVGPILALGIFSKYIRETPLRHIGSWRPYTQSAPDIGLQLPASLPMEAQWSRITKIVEATICNARKAGAHHAMAGMRLDAAEYAFGRMLEELGPVVGRPIMVSAVPTPIEAQFVTAPPATLAA